jgi:hypothetical protein
MFWNKELEFLEIATFKVGFNVLRQKNEIFGIWDKETDFCFWM